MDGNIKRFRRRNQKIHERWLKGEPERRRLREVGEQREWRSQETRVAIFFYEKNKYYYYCGIPQFYAT